MFRLSAPLGRAQRLTSSSSRLTRQHVQRRSYATEPGFQRNLVGVFSPTSAVLFVGAGLSMFMYLQYLRQKAKALQAQELENKQYGRPSIGGPFTLTDANTLSTFTSPADLLGKWSFIYFGFTNCPDICPAELDKITEVVDILSAKPGKKDGEEKENKDHVFQPIFISVDPARDSPSQIALYLQDFHSSFIGLTATGTLPPSSPSSSSASTPTQTPTERAYAQIKSICRAYRVYFSTPPSAKPTDDYLVDHSIFVYFMDPNGQFVDAFGQAVDKEEMVEKCRKAVAEWDEEHAGSSEK